MIFNKMSQILGFNTEEKTDMKQESEIFSFKCDHCGGTEWRGSLENVKSWKDVGMVTKRFRCAKCRERVSNEQANILFEMTDEKGRLKSEYQIAIPKKRSAASIIWIILLLFLIIGFFIGRSVNMIPELEAERQKIKSDLTENAEEIKEFYRLKNMVQINHRKIDSLQQVLKAGSGAAQ